MSSQRPITQPITYNSFFFLALVWYIRSFMSLFRSDTFVFYSDLIKYNLFSVCVTFRSKIITATRETWRICLSIWLRKWKFRRSRYLSAILSGLFIYMIPSTIQLKCIEGHFLGHFVEFCACENVFIDMVMEIKYFKFRSTFFVVVEIRFIIFTPDRP